MVGLDQRCQTDILNTDMPLSESENLNMYPNPKVFKGKYLNSDPTDTIRIQVIFESESDFQSDFSLLY